MPRSLSRSKEDIPELIEPCTAAEIVGHPTRTLILRYLRQRQNEAVAPSEFAATAEGQRLPFPRIANNFHYLEQAGVLANAGNAAPKGGGGGRRRTVYRLVPGPIVDWVWKFLDVIDAGTSRR